MRSNNEPAWWTRALVASFAGLIVSLMLSAFFVFGTQHNIKWAKSIERSGADMGALLVSKLRPDARKLPVKLAFVDVDEAACAAFESKDPSRCRTANPVTTALIAAFVDAARASQAAVVVIDSTLSERPEDIEVLRSTLIFETGTWVIAPVFGRPAGEGPFLNGNFSKDLVSSGIGGRLRLASFLTVPDDDAGDGIVRSYPSSVRVTAESEAWVVPSAAYLVPLLLDDTLRRQADCTYWRARCRVTATDGGTPVRMDDAAAAPQMPIPYSLPSLVQLEGTRAAASPRESIIASEMGYHRLVASRLMKPGSLRFDLSAEQVAGRIVVLGTSEPAGSDMHHTPIGPMAGSEIVLNAIRGFLELRAAGAQEAAAGTPGFWSKFATKAQGALMGFVVMTGAWLLIFLLLHRRALASPARQWRYLAGATVIFIGGLFGAACWELNHLATDLRAGHFQGLQVDLLTPILVLGLEGYAEGAKWLLGKLEHLLMQMVSAAAAVFR